VVYQGAYYQARQWAWLTVLHKVACALKVAFGFGVSRHFPLSTIFILIYLYPYSYLFISLFLFIHIIIFIYFYPYHYPLISPNPVSTPTLNIVDKPNIALMDVVPIAHQHLELFVLARPIKPPPTNILAQDTLSHSNTFGGGSVTTGFEQNAFTEINPI
jgi:hypothetical protein